MIEILSVGDVRGPLAPAVAEYEVRAEHYWRLRVTTVPRARLGRSASPDRVRKSEGTRLLGRLPPEVVTVPLTRQGTSRSSEGFARFLETEVLETGRTVIFVIGGAFGLDAAVLARAAWRMSLSSFTLPHEAARLILAEQIYRAGTILRNEPYHKGGEG